MHHKTLDYQSNLIKNDKVQAWKLLLEFNYKKTQKRSSSRPYHYIIVVDDSGSMNSTDGTSKTRLVKANEAVSMFIEERRKLADYQISGDRVSIIYYSMKARRICDYQELEKVEDFIAQAKPQFGGTSFSNAVTEIQTIIEKNSELNKVILFLSDGQDGSSFVELQQKLKSLKSKFDNKISRWWNIGFGPSADKSVMTAMIDIINQINVIQHLKLVQVEKNQMKNLLNLLVMIN